MKPFAIAAILATTLTLTACGDAPPPPAETTPPAAPAAPVEPAPVEPAPAPAPAPVEPPAATIEVPGETVIPGTSTTVNEAIDNAQQQVDDLQLTDAEKAQAVADARTQAETAARNAGLTDDQVKQAGDAAEAAAKTVFGIE